MVALFTRAWIEIVADEKESVKAGSRPLYEGVDWNIVYIITCLCENWSPSLRGRGLKSCAYCHLQFFPHRRPLYEGVDWNPHLTPCQCEQLVALFTRAWIEIKILSHEAFKTWSPSLRGRGLKSTSDTVPVWATASPSLRGRGLKYPLSCVHVWLCLVALFTRAWIEIDTPFFILLSMSSRPLYEGVDWNYFLLLSLFVSRRRPLYEGVDWNPMRKTSITTRRKSPSLRGRGLKWLQQLLWYTTIVSPSLRGRGLKFNLLKNLLDRVVSPSLRGRGLKYVTSKFIKH